MIPYYIILYYIILYYIILYYIISYHIILYHIISILYVILYYLILYYIILYLLISCLLQGQELCECRPFQWPHGPRLDWALVRAFNRKGFELRMRWRSRRRRPGARVGSKFYAFLMLFPALGAHFQRDLGHDIVFRGRLAAAHSAALGTQDSLSFTFLRCPLTRSRRGKGHPHTADLGGDPLRGDGVGLRFSSLYRRFGASGACLLGVRRALGLPSVGGSGRQPR